MTMTYIGVDVSRNWIDTFDPRTNRDMRYPGDKLAEFAELAVGAQVIFEASGG